eukprot:Nk52_evm1s2391 gene=Nk52_evmTU1s2391
MGSSGVSEWEIHSYLAYLDAAVLHSGARFPSLHEVKESWIAQALYQRRDKFRRLHGLNIVVASWNVNGRAPTESLRSWLLSTAQNQQESVDVYVIGLQELDLSTSAYLSSRDRSGRLGEWLDGILCTLVGFRVVGVKQLVGMVVAVYEREGAEHGVEEIQVEGYGTGLMNRVGNKGACVARLRIHNTWMCFVNCHLAHDMKAIGKRNKQFREIQKRMRFEKLDEENHRQFSLFRHLSVLGRTGGGGEFEFEERHGALCRWWEEEGGKKKEVERDASECPVLNEEVGENRGVVERLGEVHNPLRSFREYFPQALHEYDYAFVFGDLNYRIELDAAQTKLLIQEYNFETLINYDQLRRVMKGGGGEGEEGSIEDITSGGDEGGDGEEEQEGKEMEIDLEGNVARITRENTPSDSGILASGESGGGVFSGLREGDIAFLPTYKYDVGTQRYDTSEKQRCPAWCDRILFRSGGAVGADAHQLRGSGQVPGGEHQKPFLRQLWYCSHPDYVLSDHKPISAGFQVVVEEYDDVLLKEEHVAVVRVLDRLENECMPDAELNTNSVDFGTVTFMGGAIVKELVLENTGQVALNYNFMPKGALMRQPGEEVDLNGPVCAPWLWIYPQNGMLPRKGSVTIKLKMQVGTDTVPLLSSHGIDINDILVLHLENGKDMFLSLCGEFRPTCFGKSLEFMANTRTPANVGESIDRLDDIAQLSVGDEEREAQEKEEEYLEDEEEFTEMETELRKMSKLSSEAIANLEDMLSTDRDALEIILRVFRDGEILGQMDTIVPDRKEQNIRSVYLGRITSFMLAQNYRVPKKEAATSKEETEDNANDESNGKGAETTIPLMDILTEVELEATLSFIMSFGVQNVDSQESSGSAMDQRDRKNGASSRRESDAKEEDIDSEDEPISMVLIPQEISCLVELIREEFLDTPHIFRSSGDLQEMAEIRNLLDVHRTVFDSEGNCPSWHAHSVAEVLVQLLQSLDDGVVPANMGREGIRACGSGAGRAGCARVVSRLPLVNKAVFRYFVRFLDDVVAHGRNNGLTRDSLSLVFGPLMVRTTVNVHVAAAQLEKLQQQQRGRNDSAARDEHPPSAELTESEMETALYIANEEAKQRGTQVSGNRASFLPAIHRLKALFVWHFMRDSSIVNTPDLLRRGEGDEGNDMKQKEEEEEM